MLGHRIAQVYVSKGPSILFSILAAQLTATPPQQCRRLPFPRTERGAFSITTEPFCRLLGPTVPLRKAEEEQ